MSMRSLSTVLLLVVVVGIVAIVSRVDSGPIHPNWIVEAESCENRRRCDMFSGPVCAIDDSGMTKTFGSRCAVEMSFCRDGSYYVVVKPGEC